jgi:hypothetical protein
LQGSLAEPCSLLRAGGLAFSAQRTLRWPCSSRFLLSLFSYWSPTKVYFHFVNKLHLTLFLLFMIVLLHLEQCPNIKHCT